MYLTIGGILVFYVRTYAFNSNERCSKIYTRNVFAPSAIVIAIITMLYIAFLNTRDYTYQTLDNVTVINERQILHQKQLDRQYLIVHLYYLVMIVIF